MCITCVSENALHSVLKGKEAGEITCTLYRRVAYHLANVFFVPSLDILKKQATGRYALFLGIERVVFRFLTFSILRSNIDLGSCLIPLQVATIIQCINSYTGLYL